MSICEEFFNEFPASHEKFDKYYDTFSNFKVPKYYANSNDFGDFSKCIDLAKGKYCLIQYQSISSNVTFVEPSHNIFNMDWVDLDKSFTGAVCIPSICNANELVPKIIEKFFKDTNYLMVKNYTQEDFCQLKENFKIDFGNFIGLIFLFTILSLIFGNFYYELRNKKSNFSLSIIESIKNLFDFNEARKGEFEYMSGFKSIIIVIILWSHFILIIQQFPNRDSSKIKNFQHSIFRLHFSAQATVGTAPIILMSTLLHTINILHSLEKGKLNVFSMIIRRIIQLIPSIIFLLLIDKFVVFNLIVKYSQAPYLFKNQLPRVSQHWWSTLGYFKNYITSDIKTTSILNTYAYSVDMHFFILTFLIVYILWKWQRSTLLIFSLLIITSWSLNYNYIFKHKNYFENLLYYKIEDTIYTAHAIQTHLLMDGWIFGLFYGIFIYKHKDLNLSKKKLNIIYYGWIIYGILMLIYNEIPIFKNYVINYLPMHRFCVTLAAATFLLLIHYNVMKTIRAVCMWKFWVPINKLGQSLLLTNWFVLKWMMVLRKDVFEFTLAEIVKNFIFFIFIVIAFSLIFYILIEQPTKKFLQLYYKKNI